MLTYTIDILPYVSMEIKRHPQLKNFHTYKANFSYFLKLKPHDLNNINHKSYHIHYSKTFVEHEPLHVMNGKIIYLLYLPDVQINDVIHIVFYKTQEYN